MAVESEGSSNASTFGQTLKIDIMYNLYGCTYEFSNFNENHKPQFLITITSMLKAQCDD